jgi:SAM-dependent methyltransferase
MANFYPLHRNLIQKYHIDKVKREIIKYANGRVLDIGCGEKPFFPFIREKVESYTGVDHPDTPHSRAHIDVFATAYELPFDASEFDFVLLTQVIEHLEKPAEALVEISRVLKRGGLLIMAWPFLYPIHEAPRDFFRYTSYGMNFLAEDSGFEVQDLQAVSGFWITLFGLLSVYLYGKSRALYLFISPLLFLIKLGCLLLNHIDNNPVSRNKWTWNYYAILKKK